MLTHSQIWTAIDMLAANHGLSASGLARRAGLDPTTFNKSKRMTADGRQRWPSTESVAKVLLATGASLDDFVALVSRVMPSGGPRLPLIAGAQAARLGTPPQASGDGSGLKDLTLAALAEPGAFVLELDAESPTPLYRAGDLLVVVPESSYRRGDRLVIRLQTGTLVIGALRRETARAIEIADGGANAGTGEVAKAAISWMGRIHWASQ